MINLNTFIMIIALGITSCSQTENNSGSTAYTAEEHQVSQNAGLQNIDAEQFKAKMNEENVLIIDVRTPDEVGQGYIKGADFFIDISSASFSQQVAELDKSKTYMVYCRSGARSSRAGKFMTDNGFNAVYNLSGGIMSYTGEIERP